MKTVFAFTFRQNTKGKGFVFSAFILPVLLCLIIIGVSLFMATGSSKEDTTSPIKNIYIDNQTDMEYMDFGHFSQVAGDDYSKVKFILNGEVPKDEKFSVKAIIEDKDKECSVKLKLPEWTELSRNELKDIISGLTTYIEQLRIIDGVIKSADGEVNDQDIMTALTPVTVNHETIGDEAAGIGAYLFNYLAPLLIVFVLYMMALVYGQTISKVVISEKVSKLMETLLISVKSYQLISGKILAMAAIAIMQMILWITGVVSGIFIGDAVAKHINPGFTNYIIEALNLIRDSENGLAFSIPAVVLAIVVLIIGFLFLCVFAGMVSSPVSKAEELSSIFGVYQIVIVISFLASYMLPLQGTISPLLAKVLHVVPFTATFMLPGDIIIGRIGILESIVYIVILCAFTVAFALYTGKLYRDQVFYNNSSVNVFTRLFSSTKTKKN